ncbi:MAG TPA: bifunctional 4-hydroxy-2-oxoglutarate aldolase/2-dehydro-3-deoxy-phosphogluconate aldolase [Ohtaekwangia sp.]|nr:bifunctional 4-hydroxy-2-oxoglutarate aldolase/2-dehydro-3-deoxy-phosphogluconate aldolase [Ohtaekwangia sp.]
MGAKKEQIIKLMGDTGMIPVFYQKDIATAKSIVDAAYEGGVRVFEFTNRGSEAFGVFSQLVAYIEKYPDAVLGIGTIMNNADAEKYIEVGAQFIVSPILKPEMSGVCEEHGVNWIPGCATLTEIVTAHEAGAQLIKLFPGSVLGPGFVSAVRPVIPNIKLMPTGGVEATEKNLSAWFNAGVYCVGMGSQLLTKEIMTEKNWSLLSMSVADALATIKKIKRSER